MTIRSVFLKNRRQTLKKRNNIRKKSSRKTCRLKFRLYKNNKFVKYT